MPSAATINVFVSESDIANNLNGVVVAPTATGFGRVFLDRVVIENNSSFGLQVNGSHATARISNSVFTQNGTGWDAINTANIFSFGNNVNNFNLTSNGAPTNTVPLQ